MAFFLDVENLIAGASSLGLPLDLKPVLSRLSRQGRIATRRCFGDINAACRAINNEKVAHEVRHMLQRNLFVIEDIPHTTMRKNSADMRLIIEALSLAYTNETIGEFVILSSDRDYVPLALKLRELGRSVVTVAVSRENINRMVIDASDTVLYYDDLVGPHYGRRFARTGPTDGFAFRERDALLDTSLQHLVEAIRAVEQTGKEASLGNVGMMLRRLKADFDLESLGMPTFRAFMQRAVERGLVVAIPGTHPEDFRFTLPEARPTISQDPATIVPALAKQPETLVPYLTNLVKCIAEANAAGKTATGARVHPMLQDAIANYDLKAAGVDSFKKLVQLAEELGLVTPTWNKGDFLMELAPLGNALLGRVETPPPPDGGSGPGPVFESESEEQGHLFTPPPDEDDDISAAGEAGRDYYAQSHGAENGRGAVLMPVPFSGNIPTNLLRPRFASLDPAATVEADATDYRMFITQQLKLQQPLPPVSEWEPVLELAVQSFQQINFGDGVTLDEWKHRCLLNARTQGMRLGEVIVYKLLLSLRFAQCLVIQVGSGQYDFRVVGFHKEPHEWSDAILRNFGNQLIRLRGHTMMDPEAFAMAFIGNTAEDLARARRILDEI
jgi:uncharacterized LabA/DUF88 family protein